MMRVYHFACHNAQNVKLYLKLKIESAWMNLQAAKSNPIANQYLNIEYI